MKSLIKLADNPLTLDDDDESEEDKVEKTLTKGRKVSGPRTKLSMADRIDRMEKAVFGVATAVKAMRKDMYSAEGDLGAYDEDEDPMAVDDIDGEDEDELMLGDDFFSSDFDPYDGEDQKSEPSADETEQDEPEDIPGVSHEGDLTKGRVNRARANKSRLNRGRISKDDAASSFGEKDDDIPGNRTAGVDEKDKDAGEYLIQGDAGDGVGPVNKAVFNKAVASAVRSELAKAGLIRKAVTPGPGHLDSKVEKGIDVDALFSKTKSLSFAEIARMRVEAGDL